MKRTLLLMRHGKSKHGIEYQSDFERPLNARGKAAAPRMGRLLRELDLQPELIVSSQANRALSTAVLVAEEMDEVQLIEDERIYGAEIGELYDVICSLDDDINRVLLVGHNPDFEMFVDDLTGCLDTVMKTCSLAVIEFEGAEWSDILATKCNLRNIYHPRELGD